MASELVGRLGPKEVAKGQKAVCAGQHPIVTDTMFQVLKDGGNAADAGIAGAMVQATVQQEMTNHTGSVTCLYYEAKTGKIFQLNSTGTLVPGLPPFRPMPPGTGLYAPAGLPAPCACIPGFMPGMQALHERFATKPWDYLCAPAIRWAEEGHIVSSFEFQILVELLGFLSYFPSCRAHFMPNGYLPQVGERFKKPELAKTLRRLASEGPTYFTEGEWARQFVEEANLLGWPIKLEHMTAIPPRWQEPLRYTYKGHEIVQCAPPEQQAVFSGMVLGILDNFDLKSMGHYSESAEAIYLIAHALRWGMWQCRFLHDPEIFDVPVEVWLSKDYHKMVARILGGSKPKIDLTEHVRLLWGDTALIAAGMTVPSSANAESPAATTFPDPPTSSCELSVADAEGNWLQLLNTLQSGGIPGTVVGGVYMVGSHALSGWPSGYIGWLTGGGRMRSVAGNTLVLKDGQPVLSLGTPGNVRCTMPQVLLNILEYGMDPYEAVVAPRMLPLADDNTLTVESRISPTVVAGLAKMGILVKPLPPYEYHMGSFQMCWRDEKTGMLNSCSDPRRDGTAAGF
jgi:gamma-glutamyltranspeptidase/glutathione hydrolase